MAFNVAPIIPAITGLTVTAGVESVILKWSAVPDPVQVWRGSTLIATTSENTFVENRLTPGTAYTYVVRAARTLSNGDVIQGATATGTATPVRATIGTGQVQTTMVAQGAITGRVLFEDVGTTWVRTGLDRNDYVCPPGEAEEFYETLSFNGVGEYIVITMRVVSNGTDMYYRSQGSVGAFIQAQIQDHDNPFAPVALQTITLPVAALQVATMPIAPDQYFNTGLDRDFVHAFVLQPVTGKFYKLLMRVWVVSDEAQNYIMYESLHRHVQFDIYRR